MTFYCIYLKKNVDCNKNVQAMKTLFKRRRLSNINDH